jgi:hypothetical protein
MMLLILPKSAVIKGFRKLLLDILMGFRKLLRLPILKYCFWQHSETRSEALGSLQKQFMAALTAFDILFSY